MNDLTAWTESGYYSPDPGLADDERFRNEPFVCVPPRRPPCDDCQHSARCARDNLACCAFVVYLSARRPDERHEHRAPSAEWYAYAAREYHLSKPPHCAECAKASRGRGAGEEKAATEARRMRIVALLSERPGLEANEIADAIGVRRKSALKYVTRLEELGLIVGERGKRGLRGHRKVLWSVANG